MNQSVKQNVLEAVMNDPRLFSQELRSIPLQAEHIQRELERTVWNGNVRESDGQSKVLLWNISDAGARTKMVFEQSIGNLHETVVSGILNDVEFQASLAVDIMDRNLYERANDCRWWALTSAFRKILSQNEISTIGCGDHLLDSGATSTGCTLCIPTCSCTTSGARFWPYPTSPSPASWALSFPTTCHTRRCVWTIPRPMPCLRSRPRPCMTGGTPTSTGRPSPTWPSPTGAWAASASSSTANPSSGRCCSTPCRSDEQGEVLEGLFRRVHGPQGQNYQFNHANGSGVGEILQLDSKFFCLKNGTGASEIIEFEDSYYAVGAKVSAGYREYKVDDGYRNDIVGPGLRAPGRGLGTGRDRSSAAGRSA